MDNLKKQKELEDYRVSLESKTIEELHEIEKQLIEEADENDAKLSRAEFELPEKNYVETAKAVKALLNKQEVGWQYTMAMIGLHDFWNEEKKPEKINFAMLDSVLRTLGGMQFKGYEEWAMVLAINAYFDPIKDQYAGMLETTYDIASKHDMLLKELDKRQPAEEQQINE